VGKHTQQLLITLYKTFFKTQEKVTYFQISPTIPAVSSRGINRAP